MVQIDDYALESKRLIDKIHQRELPKIRRVLDQAESDVRADSRILVNNLYKENIPELRMMLNGLILESRIKLGQIYREV